MEYEVIVRKNGEIVVQVLDRKEHLCSSIYQLTALLGKTVSDEEIGPECDEGFQLTIGQ